MNPLVPGNVRSQALQVEHFRELLYASHDAGGGYLAPAILDLAKAGLVGLLLDLLGGS